MNQGREERPFSTATIGMAVLTILLLLGSVTVAQAGIAGSKHDFSGQGWGTTDACAFCHTPHGGVTVTGTNVPLWNHKMTTATYTLYSSSSLQYAPQQPRNQSKLCLSCHDGTVAIDSYGTRTGSHFATGNANLGTNLSNDHPISIQWAHQTMDDSINCEQCHAFPSDMRKTYTPMYKDSVSGLKYMECGSCHEPHDKYPAYGKMLRYTMNGSQLCLLCHGK